jgi:hypothetical protein
MCKILSQNEDEAKRTRGVAQMEGRLLGQQKALILCTAIKFF